MTENSKIWTFAKVCTYSGGLIVAGYVAMLGFFHRQPPDLVFYLALCLIGTGVVAGNVVVLGGLFRRGSGPTRNKDQNGG